MKERRKKITALLMVHTNTWFTEMYNLAILLRDSQRYEPIVHFAYQYPTTKRDIGKLKSEGIAYSEAPTSSAPRAFDRALVALANLPQWRGVTYLPRILAPGVRSLKNLAISIREIEYYKHLVEREKAGLVVLAGDLVGYNTPEIVRAARAADVPCVILPSTMSDGTEQAEAYFFDRSFAFDQPFNRLAGWMWPKWKKQHKGKWLVRLPGEQIVPRELLGISPPLPWVSSSSLADRIAVESRAMWDYYRRCGIETDKLELTGTLANDALAATTRKKDFLRSQLLDSLGLDPRKGIALTALPPDFLYMPGGRPECEFSNYRALTEYWIGALDGLSQFNTVISLHPSVDPHEFRYLETNRVRIAPARIVELIPLCDFFVASVSSTIRWAITCAKPVVNYDVYKYRYTDFSAVKGVVYVDRKDTYQGVLTRIDKDPAYRDYLDSEIGSEAAHWGCLDGAEGNRVLSLFDKEIESHGRRR